MSSPNNIFRGDSPPIAQVDTVTVGGTANNGQQYGITINGKSVTYTANNTDTNNTIASALQVNLTASAIPEFAEIVWTAATNVITATAGTAGNNFTIASVAATGTGTLTHATSTVSSGPNDWSTAANWTQNRIPAGQLSPPVQSNISAVAGGSLTEGTTYYWVITALNANGETVVSNEKSYTPGIGSGNDTAGLSWTTVTGATGGYNVYRSTTSGTYGATSKVTNVTQGTTTYNDTGTALVAGQPPGVSTAVGDNVYLTQNTTPINYGLAQGGLLYNALYADASFTGGMGLPVTNQNGYYEYRERYLQAGAINIYIGNGLGQGCSIFQIDLGSLTVTNIEIIATGTAQSTTVPAVQFIGGTVTNLSIIQGSVGFAIDDGTTSTITTIWTGYQNSQASDVNLTLGSGCSLTTVDQYGGTINAQSNITTLSIGQGSTFTMLGTGITVTTLNGEDGTFSWEGTGTITTAYVGSNFTLDCGHNTQAKTLTNCTLYKGASLLDPGQSITFTNPFLLSNCRLADVTLDLGSNFHLQRS